MICFYLQNKNYLTAELQEVELPVCACLDSQLHQGQGTDCSLVPRKEQIQADRMCLEGVVCSGAGPPRQLLVSSVIVKNQERSLSLVICSSSVTNFSSMGHLV